MKSSFGLLLLIQLLTGPTSAQSGQYSLSLITDDDQAVCNDNSPAGYYFRSGGGYCFDLESCQLRWEQSPSLMSSKTWATKITMDGIFSSNSTQNPFWDWNIAFIPYCSSDSWCGTNESSINGWKFMGRWIVPAVLRDLQNSQGLLQAKSVILSGSSAGAEGLWTHSDRVAAALSYATVRTVVDRAYFPSGWFMDYQPFETQGCTTLGRCTEQGALERGVHIWAADPQPACAQAYPGLAIWHCMLGYHAFPFMKTPMLIFQWGFDSAQMGHDGIDSLPSGPALAYAQAALANLSLTYQADQVNAYYTANCYQHTITGAPWWTQVRVNGMSFPSLIQAWFAAPAQTFHYFDTCDTPNCNPTCP